MNSQNKKSTLKGLILKLGLTFGLVVVCFVLFGFLNKAEAATAEFKLNSEDTNDQRSPVVSIDSSNRFYIAWEDNRGDPFVYDIFGRIYNSSGGSVTNDAALDKNETTSCSAPSAVINSAGNVLLSWQDNRFGSDEVNVQSRLFRYGVSGEGELTSLGRAQFGPGGDDEDFRINDDISNFECDTPWVTTNGTNFTIGYYNKNLGAMTEGDDGTRIKLAFVNGTAFPKDKKTALAGDYQSAYNTREVAVIENKTSKLTWKRAVAWVDDDHYVYVQLYRGNGNKYGSEEKVHAQGYDPRWVNLAVNNQGHLAVTWTKTTVSWKSYYMTYNGSWSGASEISPSGGTEARAVASQVVSSGSSFYFIYANGSATGSGGSLKNTRLEVRKLGGGVVRIDDLGVIGSWTRPHSVDFSVMTLPKEGNELLRLGLQYSLKGTNNWYLKGAQLKITESFSQLKAKGVVQKTLVGSGNDGTNYYQPRAAQVSPGKYCLFYRRGSNTIKTKFFGDRTFVSGGGTASFLVGGDPISFSGNNPQIAIDNNGAVGVAYGKDDKIYLRRYDPNLKALAGAVRVDEESTASANFPSICALSDGDFLVGFRGKYQGSTKFQAQQVMVKAFSSSLTSSSFSPPGFGAEPLSLLGNLVSSAHAQGAIELLADTLEWTEITWAKSGTGSQSTIIVQVSTDEGEHWLAVSNGDRISDKIKSSGVDMPALSKTIKYRIIANSTGGGGKPQVDWIQIGYGPAVTDYDYFMKVTPASAKVVINTTKTVTVKVTRKEAEEEGAQAEPLTLVPKAHAQAIERSEEPVSDQEVTAGFTSGGHGKLKLISTEGVSGGGEGTEPESEGTEPEEGTTPEGDVQGEAIEQKGGSDIDPQSITGRTDENGEFKFYYEAPSEYNLEDIIQVSTTPTGESEIKVDVTMVTVYPVNTVFTSDPAFVGHNKEVTFSGAITNHISVPVNNIAADMRLNQSLTYISDSATINGRKENVRVVMQNGRLRFECLGTEGAESELGGGEGAQGDTEGEPGSVQGRQIAADLGFSEGGESGILKPGETVYLAFRATARVVEGEGEGLGEGSSNLYEAGLTLSYKEQESGKSYQNGEVTAQGTVASIWLQTLFGDIYAQGGFAADVMPPSGNQNATYLVQTDGTISHFTSKAGSRYEIQNYIQGILSPVNVKRLMRDQVDQILADRERFKVREITPGLHRVSDLDKGRREVVYVKGDLVLETDADFRSPLTIVVTGDLRIKDSTNYDNTPVDSIKKLPSLGLIVLGDTIIESDVTHGVGAVYSEGTISTGDSNKQLVWEGLFVASGFNLDRTHFHTGDVTEPAEKVIYDGRVVANPPTGFSELTDFPVWKEVAP